MSKARERKVRRQNKQALNFGWSAKPTHKGRSGRTGGMFAKQLKSRR